MILRGDGSSGDAPPGRPPQKWPVGGAAGGGVPREASAQEALEAELSELTPKERAALRKRHQADRRSMELKQAVATSSIESRELARRSLKMLYRIEAVPRPLPPYVLPQVCPRGPNRARTAL